MSLGFLTADAPSRRDLRARSPMERKAVAAGAWMSTVAGWNVPLAFQEPTTEQRRISQTVGFADRSSLTKLELHAEPQALAKILARAHIQHAAADGSLGPGMAARSAGGPLAGTWWCPVRPDHLLVLGEPGQAVELRQQLARELEEAQGTTTLVDVTCALAALSLVGPSARELVARFCALDLRPAVTPPGGFRPGSVARTPGYVLVERADRLLVLVGWALGEYLWDVVADAASALGGGPVGMEALSHEEGASDA